MRPARGFSANFKNVLQSTRLLSVVQTRKRTCPRYDFLDQTNVSKRSKAVADGAIGFYCDHHVSARVAKFMYGVEYLRAFDPKDPGHLARKDRLTELPSGPKLLADAFDCILARVSRAVLYGAIH